LAGYHILRTGKLFREHRKLIAPDNKQKVVFCDITLSTSLNAAQDGRLDKKEEKRNAIVFKMIVISIKKCNFV